MTDGEATRSVRSCSAIDELDSVDTCWICIALALALTLLSACLALPCLFVPSVLSLSIRCREHKCLSLFLSLAGRNITMLSTQCLGMAC